MIAMDLNSVSCVTYFHMQKVRFTFFFSDHSMFGLNHTVYIVEMQ